MIYKKGLVSLGINHVGGTITSFQIGDKHIFYPQQIIKENGELKLRGGSHICFPNFGTNQTSGMNLSRHGFIRDSEFSKFECYSLPYEDFIKLGFVKFLKNKAKVECISLEYNYIPNITRNDVTFNYGFRMKSSFYFLDNGFIQNVKISRPSIIDFPKEPRNPIPINLGFHPYFEFPFSFKKSKIYFGKGLQGKEYISNKETFVDIVKPMPTDGNVRLLIADMAKIHMQFGGLLNNYPDSQIVLWRPGKSSPFICVEPVSADNKFFGTPKGLYLKPEEDSVNAWMMITVDE